MHGPVCAIVGDCIATKPYGLGGQLTECEVSAKAGLPSGKIVSLVPKVKLDWLVISAGTNDPTDPRLANNLQAMRARAKATVVIWIVPVAPKAAEAVRSVAAAHGDKTVTFVPGVGGTQARVHPRSYRALARAVLDAVGTGVADR